MTRGHLPNMLQTTSFTLVMTAVDGKRSFTRALGLYESRSKARTAKKQAERSVRDVEAYEGIEYSFQITPFWLPATVQAFSQNGMEVHPKHLDDIRATAAATGITEEQLEEELAAIASGYGG